jgi:hypothetical protein
LPRRLAHREDMLSQADRNLQSTCEAFAARELGPKSHDLVKRASGRMAIALKAHFSAKPQLDEAVACSAPVMEAKALEADVVIDANPVNGTVPYAQRLLGTWANALALEARLK